MRNCKYCGGEVSDTAKKCKHCGEWLNEENEQTEVNKPNIKTCEYCGGDVPFTAKKCIHCGENFIEEHQQKSLNKNAQIKNDANNTKTFILVVCITLVVFLVIIILIIFNKSGVFDNLNSNAIEKIIKTANTTEQGYEDVGQESKIYKLMEKDYNQISNFKDKQTAADTSTNTDYKAATNNYTFCQIGDLMADDVTDLVYKGYDVDYVASDFSEQQVKNFIDSCLDEGINTQAQVYCCLRCKMYPW